MEARSAGAPIGQEIRVLVATQVERVCGELEARHDVKYDLSLFPDAIISLLSESEVVIIDYADVGGEDEDKSRLRQAIYELQNQGRLDEFTSEEFLANPATCLEGTGGFGRMRRLRPNCCIAFVSYSGGTGRTSLALDTAFYFAETLDKHAQKARKGGRRESDQLPLPQALMVEMTFGISSLAAVTGLEMPYLMQLAVDSDIRAQRYRGVELVPMDYDNVRVLAVDLLRRYFDRQMALYPLTVVDTIWPHSLSDALAKRVDLWLVVATERPDTVSNAVHLADELRATYGEDKVWLLQNESAGNGTKKEARSSRRQPRWRRGRSESAETPAEESTDLAGGAAAGLRGHDVVWQVRVPPISRPEEFQGQMGKAVLSRVFAPIWKEYDPTAK